MPQYVYFNSALPSPSPVIGWYDTDKETYPNLPATVNLFEVTAAQWTARNTNGAVPSDWAISNGALIAYTPPVLLPTLAQQAAALQATGLAIISTATPALNATYPADVNTVTYINSELNALQQNSTFADGATVIEWPDTAVPAVLHEMDITQFKQFAAQIGVFVSGCRKCIIGVTGATLPAAQANID